ncbi:MAG: hypothetical protein HFJ80_02570 [Clostridiales bacterium]|nr:hypothetical protein [Clostridiales bacterium]
MIFSYNFKGVLNDYNYRNDFVNNWYQIISEYSADAIRSYQFYWGVLYTMDEGETFTTVFKHEYRQKMSEDAVFKSLFDGLKDEMPHYTADATAALPAKV